MINENLEIAKDCVEFEKALNDAYNELHREGQVSIEKHEKVCDSFADNVAKLYTHQKITNREIVILFLFLLNVVCEYGKRTGNYIDINLVLKKIGIEMLPEEYKFYLSCLQNQ